MLTTELKETFFSLVRLGIGNGTISSFRFQDSGAIDWNALEALAAQHGLSAVLVDGVERLPDGQRPPKPVLLQWIGETLQGFEYRYELYCRTIAEMAAFYNEHGYKMMVLKGYACSLDWPKPEHRPCGDIDIWQFGEQKAADAALLNLNDNLNDNEGSPDGSKSVKNPPQIHFEIDNSHHHHSVFYWRDFMVENHYDFINVHHHKSNVEFEKILKELGSASYLDDPSAGSGQVKLGTWNLKPAPTAHGLRHGYVDVYGEKVYLPSPNLHALFLLKHTMMHFAAEGITLRQLIDWAFFVRAHCKDVDWPWLEGVLEEFGMRRLYDVFNAICVEDLGFEVGIFQRVQFEPVLKDRVLNEILNPEFSEELPKSVFRRIAFKLRRWRGSAWKHELCYKDSLWSAFWSGVWNHIIKPSSI